MKVLEADINNVEGWLWLARMSDQPKTRRKCLQAVQRLDPENAGCAGDAGGTGLSGQRTGHSCPGACTQQPSRPLIPWRTMLIHKSQRLKTGHLNPQNLKLNHPGVEILGNGSLGQAHWCCSWGWQRLWLLGIDLGALLNTGNGSENIYVEYILDASASMNEALPDGVSKVEAAKSKLSNSLKAYRPESSVGLAGLWLPHPCAEPE